MRYLIFGLICFVALNASAAEDAQLQPSVPVNFSAAGGPAKTVSLGSTDPNSSFKFLLELNAKGASLSKAVFGEFDDRDYKNPKPLVVLSPVRLDADREILSMANTDFVFVQQQQKLSLDRLNWQSSDVITSPDGSQTARFEATIRNEDTGEPVVKLVKTYTIYRGSYHLDCNLTVENLSPSEQKVRFNLNGPVGISREDPRTDERKIVGGFRDLKGQITGVRTDVRNFDLYQKFDEEVLGGDYQKNQEFLWAAVVNKYFAAILVPLPENDKGFCGWISGRRDQAGSREIAFKEIRGFSSSVRRFFTGKSTKEQVEKTGRFGRFYNPDGIKANGDESIGAGVEIDFADIAPAGQANASRTYGFQLYIGPKDKSLFDKNERYKTLGFVQTIDFMACCCPAAIINPLAFGILATMKWMYGFIYNYGIVIIILVFLLRLIMHPITKKSQVSMSKMSKLAPKVEEIRKKFADNKTEMNRQIMSLYREHGATPIMSMLPIMVQMPIWIALWSAVNTSIDLRGASFLPFWITDLSGPDALFRFPAFTLPLFGRLDSFNLLPLLMGVAFYLQQKLTPTQSAATTSPQMAQQQKMMMFMMPLMFPLMLYNAPSGVNLYIMASTFAGVVEQYVIKKHIQEKERAESEGLVEVTSKTGGKVKKKKPKPFFRT